MKIKIHSAEKDFAPVVRIETCGKVRATADAAEPLFAKFDPARIYTVLAVEFHAAASDAYFWVLGETFRERCEEGVFRPDLVRAGDCTVIDSSVPASWITGVTHFRAGTHTVTGSPAFAEAYFLDRLLAGDRQAVSAFMNVVNALVPDAMPLRERA